MEELQKLVEDLKLDKEIFTPELMEKISVIFDAKLEEKKQAYKTEIEEKNNTEMEAFRDELTEQINKYINYFVDEYITENEDTIYDSVQVKTAGKVLENFNNLVKDFNITTSNETVNYGIEVDDLKEKLNSSINKNISLQDEMSELTKASIIETQKDKLKTDSEKDRFVRLAENYEYEDEISFKQKIVSLSENLGVLNSVSTEKDNTLEEQETESFETQPLTEEKDISNVMTDYIARFKRLG